MPPLKFYTDTHIDKQVAMQLRAQGIDIVRCEEVQLAEADDETHLKYAANDGRILVTKDEGFRQRHFRWLHEEMEHAGIFFCSNRQHAAIGTIVKACREFSQLVEEGAATLDDIRNKFFDIRED
jgi:predicted nuclease of predicted toxin-antitoxin system